MKFYKFDISERYIEGFFIPIRKKTSVIKVLMKALQYMFINPSVPQEKIVGKLLVQVDKMSRLFFITDGKYYSIVLPCTITEKDNIYNFKFNGSIDIDHDLVSKVLTAISYDELLINSGLDIFDSISEFENKNEDFREFLKGLLLMDDGYIRYDYDEKTNNQYKEQGQEHHHPLNHYDIFYSTRATFKIGLPEKLNQSEFIDVLNTKSECKYLKKFSL